MTWILGLLGWGSAAAIAAVLLMGLVVPRHWLLIAAGVGAAALLAWGATGYNQANGLQKRLDEEIEKVAAVTAERDKARTERAAALDAAETCSASVAALKDAADKREKDAAPARQQAARTARTNQQRAAAILAAPPSVPGDDAASAQAQIDQWLKERNP
jgi:hypothetical protein